MKICPAHFAKLLSKHPDTMTGTWQQATCSVSIVLKILDTNIIWTGTCQCTQTPEVISATCVEALLITDPLFLSMKSDHIRLYNSSAPTAENPSRTSFIFQIIPAIRIEKGEGKPQICMVDHEIKQIII